MQKVKKIKDVEFAHGLKLDIYVPDACVSTFIYFHGGGLSRAIKATLRFLPMSLPKKE